MSPGQRLMLGRCTDCSRLLFARQPHEWAHRDTHELCWPHDTGAALYCGLCSDDHRHAAARPRVRAG